MQPIKRIETYELAYSFNAMGSCSVYRLECVLVQGASFSRYGSSYADLSQDTNEEFESCKQESEAITVEF